MKTAIRAIFALSLATLSGFLVKTHGSAAPSTSPSVNSSNQKVSVYVASQYSLVTGDHLITFCPQGFRDDYLKRNVSTVARPPEWTAYTFNRQTLSCYKSTPAAFKGYLQTQVALTTGRSLQSIAVAPAGQSSLLNHKTLVYKTIASVRAANKAEYARAKEKHGAILGVNYEIAKDISIPALMSKLYAQSNGILDKKGFPLSVTFENASDENREYIMTTKLTQTKANQSVFAIPEKLNYVNDIHRVFATEAGMDAEKYLMDY